MYPEVELIAEEELLSKDSNRGSGWAGSTGHE